MPSTQRQLANDLARVYGTCEYSSHQVSKHEKAKIRAQHLKTTTTTASTNSPKNSLNMRRFKTQGGLKTKSDVMIQSTRSSVDDKLNLSEQTTRVRTVSEPRRSRSVEAPKRRRSSTRKSHRRRGSENPEERFLQSRSHRHYF